MKWIAMARRVIEDPDSYVFGGIALIGIGLWQVDAWLGLVIPGALIGALGVWMSLPPGRSE